TSTQQYGEATKLISRLTKEVPNTEAYLFNLADLYLMQNRFDDALKTYDRIEKKYGQLEEISFKKQQIYLRQNNLDKALQEGRNLIEANPNDVRYLLAQAELYYNNNKPEEAMQLIDKSLRTDPTNAQARLMYAELLRSKGRAAESEEQLKLAFGSTSIDIDTKVKILIDQIRQLPNEKVQILALQLADSTIKTHPGEAKAYAVAADIQTIAGKKQPARDNYLKAIKLDNSHFKIWQQVVLLDAELNQIDSLIAHSEKALELFPNQAIFWFYNGTGYMIQKKYSKAVKSLEFGKKLSSENKEMMVQFNIQLGDSYHSLKEFKKSDEAYEEALAYDSNNAHVLNNYSYFLSVRNENLPKAKILAGKLVKQNPNNATYLDTYAWVLYKLKEYQDARLYLEQAIANTSDATVVEHYGDVLFQLGHRDEAVEQWMRAKAMGGDTSEFIDKKIKDKKLYE
ncbi:MAG: tetratricopeptide repeat protein, partial [Hymenobacteraceae bacterium]|nr:tetratricopeptide repeat protein [Hymenobacteraceae bacterium]MDX5394796.1 tetratricopeptide repeat protein [Hymenobacteraceae bacterium]MDX5444061.1 tetratricopeptide repeat protein [Hymenobacteraceae bacterium]MDX5510826.1 tetratricopeptide repeat protein [Hymenobacteraceae bacterium]